MLDLDLENNAPQTIAEFDFVKLKTRQVQTAVHCFGCTAGAGSSCGGVVASGS